MKSDYGLKLAITALFLLGALVLYFFQYPAWAFLCVFVGGAVFGH